MRERRRIMENSGVRRTHDMGMIETLEHLHLAPHALLVSPDFLLQNGPQCGLVCDVPRCRLCGGTPHGCEGERDSGERVGGGGEGRRGWASGAALSEGPLFW